MSIISIKSKYFETPKFEIPKSELANVQENIDNARKNKNHTFLEKFTKKLSNGKRVFKNANDYTQLKEFELTVAKVKLRLTWALFLHYKDHLSPLLYSEDTRRSSLICHIENGPSFVYKNDNDFIKRLRHFKNNPQDYVPIKEENTREQLLLSLNEHLENPTAYRESETLRFNNEPDWLKALYLYLEDSWILNKLPSDNLLNVIEYLKESPIDWDVKKDMPTVVQYCKFFFESKKPVDKLSLIYPLKMSDLFKDPNKKITGHYDRSNLTDFCKKLIKESHMINYDVFFEIKHQRVYLIYNQIVGSRWLASVKLTD